MESAHNEDVPQQPDSFLSGGGEMGARMREFDWSKTSLGPAEHWPQSLKIAVRIMLTSRQPIWLGWGEDLIKLYNDAYISIVGGKHPEALGQSAFVVWREILNEIGPMLKTAMGGAQGTYVEEQLLIMERNGYPEETYYTFSYSPIPNDEGRAGGIICANTEETAKVLSARRLRTFRLLFEQVAQTKSAVEVCKVASINLEDNPKDIPFALLYLLDADGEHAHLAGTTRIAAGTMVSPESLKIDDGKNAIWPLRRVIDTGEGQVVTGIEERFGKLPGGAWPESPKQAIILPLANPGQDKPTGFLVAGISPRLLFDDSYRSFMELTAGHIATAIANARAYEEERKRAEALAELDRAKTAFFSNVSHEFRTPLTLMLGPLEDTISNAQDPAQKEELEVVHRNGLRLLKLVNTLLDFSRIEAGRTQAVYELTDLSTLTAELASVFRSAIERAGMRLIIDCPPLPKPIYIDREMWEKIVLNLLSNAYKFTFEGAISVSLTPAEGRVELRVRDTGTGIAETDLPHLFERFHRIRGAQARTHEGTGIGLALVQELVKLHGGSVGVESEVGKGTTFTVSIPTGSTHIRADWIKAERTESSTALGAQAYLEEALHWLPGDAQAESSMAEDEVLAGGPRIAAGIPARIILADDNADMREYVKRILSQHWTVEAVSDGAAALDAARERVPDLVLSDVMMPGLDGFELLRELRKDPLTRQVPVILLSARAGEESRIEGLEVGADDYMVKPFSARELLARVGAHLELSRVRRASQEQVTNILESITDGFLALDRQWRYIYINAEAERMGLSRAELLGRSLWDAFPDILSTQVETELRRAVAEQVTVEYENYYKPWNKWFENKAFPSTEGNLVIYFRDITERKQAESLLAAQKSALEMIAQGAPLGEVLEDLIRVIEKQSGAAMVGSILLLDRDGIHLRHGAAPSLPESYNRAIDGIAIGPRVGSCGTAAYLSKPVIVTDIQSDPLWADFRDLALGHSLRACWSTPIVSSDGKVLGTFAMYYREPRSPGAQDLQIIELVTRTAGIAIERTRTEQALRESEERFRAFVTASSDVVYSMSADWSEMRHLEGRDFIPDTADPSRSWHAKYIHPDDQPHVLATIQEAIRNRSIFELEHRVIRVDGTLGWTFSRAIPLVDEQGEIVEWFGAASDVTERKRAEEAVARLSAEAEQQRRLYQTILSNTPDLVYVFGLDHCFTYANEALLMMWGKTWDEAIGRNCLELGYEPWHAAMHDREIDQVIATKQPIRGEVPFTGAYGRRIYDYIFVPVLGADGKVEAIAGTTRDVTERKQAEETLRLNESQLQTLFDEVPMGVYLVDGDFRIRKVNPIALPTFGDITDLIGMDFDEVVHILWPKKYADEIVAIFRRTLETGEPYFTPERIEERIDRGVTEYYEWQINRIPLPEGGWGVVCYFRDISAHVLARLERERLLVAEREAREAADDASRAKDEFLATVSHELRTPLNAMLGWSRLLSGGRLDEEAAARGLSTIERNAKAQAQLIEDLLDVSRIITGKFRLNNEPVQVVRVIESAVDSVRPASEAKGVRLQVTLDPDAGPVSGDAGRIQQVVWNLLSNAVKFTPKGGRVQVLLTRINSHIEIVVSDTGQGIEPEFLPHVFNRFSQADGSSTRSHGGLGLGLAIVRHIVELHGGDVSVQSMGKGQGATFTVKLPVMVIRTKPGDQERVHPRVDSEQALQFRPSLSLEGVKVLLVDDDPETLILLSTVLTRSGASVKTAPSAEEGFRELKAWGPDIVVSDIGMPGEDGHSFMKRVKTWAKESNVWIPAVALTAYARTEDRMKALSSGYQMHVPKPVEPAELITVIANLIDRL